MNKEDAIVIKTIYGRSILRFRCGESTVADVYEQANVLGITVSEFIRLSLRFYLNSVREIEKKDESTRLEIMEISGIDQEEEKS